MYIAVAMYKMASLKMSRDPFTSILNPWSYVGVWSVTCAVRFYSFIYSRRNKSGGPCIACNWLSGGNSPHHLPDLLSLISNFWLMFSVVLHIDLSSQINYSEWILPQAAPLPCESKEGEYNVHQLSSGLNQKENSMQMLVSHMGEMVSKVIISRFW